MMHTDDEVVRQRRMGQLFILAMASRTILMSLGVHWGIIGSMVLVGAPIDWSADYTFPITAMLVVATVLVFISLNGDGRVSARMRRGPDDLLRHSLPIVVTAVASDIGGMMLFSYGEESAALWAMGLSTFVVVCELSALIGSSYLGSVQSQDGGGQS